LQNFIKNIIEKADNTTDWFVHIMSCHVVQYTNLKSLQSCSQIHIPDWGHKVNSCIRLLYQYDRLHRLAGRNAGVNFIPPVMDSKYGYGTSIPVCFIGTNCFFSFFSDEEPRSQLTGASGLFMQCLAILFSNLLTYYYKNHSTDGGIFSNVMYNYQKKLFIVQSLVVKEKRKRKILSNF
jgi:hypothetical protein